MIRKRQQEQHAAYGQPGPQMGGPGGGYPGHGHPPPGMYGQPPQHQQQPRPSCYLNFDSYPRLDK